MTDKKTSLVWDYFKVKIDDVSKCHCSRCDSVISRGKPDQPKKFSTSAMLTHLRTKHRKDYDELQKRQDESKAATTPKLHVSAGSAGKPVTVTSGSVQPTLGDRLERAKIWDINSNSAVRMHRAIAKMIVTDIQLNRIMLLKRRDLLR